MMKTRIDYNLQHLVFTIIKPLPLAVVILLYNTSLPRTRTLTAYGLF